MNGDYTERLSKYPESWPYTNKYGAAFSLELVIELYECLREYSKKFGEYRDNINVEAAEAILYVINTYQLDSKLSIKMYTKYCFRQYLFNTMKKDKMDKYGKKSEERSFCSFNEELHTKTDVEDTKIDYKDMIDFLISRTNKDYGDILTKKLEGWTNDEIGTVIGKGRHQVGNILKTIGKVLKRY